MCSNKTQDHIDQTESNEIRNMIVGCGFTKLLIINKRKLVFSVRLTKISTLRKKLK